MPRLRTVLCSLVALCANGFALAVQEDGGDAQAPARRPGANPPRAQAAAQPVQTNMDDLLNLWAGQSAKLTSLEVDIYRIDKNPAWWDEEEHYLGHAAFKSPQLAYLDFRKVELQTQVDPNDKNKKKLVPLKKNGRIQSKPYQTIICTGAEVWDYHYGVKPQIFIYTLDKDGRKRAIEEGPLPFLFNMRANEAKQRYEMVLFSEDEKRYLVQIKPLFQEEKERFSFAWISLDRAFLLPKRIVLIAPDGKSMQDFRLSAINANNPGGVDGRMFKGVNPGKPWKVVRNPGGPAPAAPANARTSRRQAVEQAARPDRPIDGDQPR